MELTFSDAALLRDYDRILINVWAVARSFYDYNRTNESYFNLDVHYHIDDML